MKTFTARLAASMFAVLVAVSVGFAQEQKSNDADQKDDQQQAKQAAQEQQEKQQALRKAQQEARDKLRETREQAREENRDQRQEARQGVRDANNRDDRQDARKDTRDTRESARDNRDEARDENREVRRDARENTRQRVQSFFRARTGADLGLNFDKDNPDRLSIMELDRDSLGTRLGLRRGDVILSVNGRGVRSSDEFDRWISINPGQASTIMFQRDGRQYSVQLQPRNEDRRAYSLDSRGMSRAYLGVTFDPNYREFAVIREVKSDSPAEKIGLKPGDTLTHVNGQEVRTLQHAVQMLGSMPADEEFEIEFDRPQHQAVRVTMVNRDNQRASNGQTENQQD
jgi:C-terminal processing protease CtpA/Prc